MQIDLSGKNVELTEAIKNYVEKKITGLEKFFDRITKAKVIVGLETNHHQKGEIFFCECRLDLPGKEIFVLRNEKDLYKAIDNVRDHIEQELKKYKVSQREKEKKDKRQVRDNKEYKI